MSYHSNKKLVNEMLAYIRTTVERRTGIIGNLEQFLREDVNVWIYTEMPPAVRANYDKFLETYDKGIHDFRGLCFTNQFIRAKKMSRKEESSRIDIVLHNLYETPESLAWVMLHELMHAKIKTELYNGNYDGLTSFIHSMNWVWEDRVDRTHPSMKHGEYYNTDEGHEAKPEEIICNLYATGLIGINYDRHWWRKLQATIRRQK